MRLLFNPKDTNFLKLWLAQLISQFGDRVNQMAVIGLAAERFGASTSGLAKLLAFTIIPVFIVQPFAGAYVDRWDKRTTLFVCDMVRGIIVLFIVIALYDQKAIMPIYIALFFSFGLSRFHVPAKMSIIPEIVPEDKIIEANSLVSITGMIAFILGVALGGFLIEEFGARYGFLFDAITFFVSATLLLSIQLRKHLTLSRENFRRTRDVVFGAPKSIFNEIYQGFSYLLARQELRVVIAMLFVLLAAAGSVYVVIIVFIEKAFSSVTKDLSILGISLGIGLFLGALCYGQLGKKSNAFDVIFFCLTLGGLMLTVFAWLIHLHPNISMAMLLAMVLGIVIGPTFIASNAITHIVSDEAMRGKVFSAIEIVIHFSFLLAMLLSSYISNFVAEYWILCGVGVLVACVGLTGFLKSSKLESSLE